MTSTTRRFPFLLPVTIAGLIAGFFLARDAAASGALDKAYGLRNVVAVVINADQDPVYSEHVENEMVRYLRENGRFEFPDKAYLYFKDKIKTVNLLDSKVPLNEKLDWMKPQILELRQYGVDAVLIAEVSPGTDTCYLSFLLVTTNKAEFIRFRTEAVEDRFSLASFSVAIESALSYLTKQIPFDGNILRRDGYRVVVDRGTPDVSQGMQISAYTVEQTDGKFHLEETGLIEITEPGEQVSFGKILVEKKPREVVAMNKILLKETRPVQDLATLFNDEKLPARQFGLLDFQVGASLVTLTNTSADGAGSRVSNYFYPEGSLRGEAWITSYTFVELGFDFALANLKFNDGQTASLSSSISDLRAQVGYRFGLGDSRVSPTINLRAGYAKHQVKVDVSPDPLAFTSTNYTGLLAGGGVGFPITDKWGVAFDIDALLFPSLTETPATRGASINSVTGWDFSLKSYYRFSRNIDALFKLDFESYNSEFIGQGTRTYPVASSSQSSQAITTGIAYYF